MAEPVQLTRDEMGKMLPRIMSWRLDPDAPVSCPRCDRPGVTIIDRSARPYAEWYALGCPDCGLDATVNIPLGPPVMGGFE
ncbi:MAG: hypothetical protein ABL894_12530 [Hyphomicrobium sp.]